MARVDRLEQLLLPVVAKGTQSSQSGVSDTLQSMSTLKSTLNNFKTNGIINGSNDTVKDPELGQLVEAFGLIHVEQAKDTSAYIGGAHWPSVMCKVSLQSYRARLSFSTFCVNSLQ